MEYKRKKYVHNERKKKEEKLQKYACTQNTQQYVL